MCPLLCQLLLFISCTSAEKALSAPDSCSSFASIVSIETTWNWKIGEPAWLVIFSICDSIKRACGKTPSGCGVCQQWSDASNGNSCLGKFSNAVYVGGEVEVLYTEGDTAPDGTGRTADIYLKCGSGAEIEPVFFLEANDHLPGKPYQYKLDVLSPLVCTGIGFGAWALIIIFLILLPIYLIGGYLLNRYVRRKDEELTHLELLPNYEFWSQTPALCVEGIFYTKNKIRDMI